LPFRPFKLFYKWGKSTNRNGRAVVSGFSNFFYFNFCHFFMMPSTSKIPVYIITGFLGAGKTTFLNHFIKSLNDKRILVIENEIGKTNIDGALIIESVQEVRELTAGCLCCDLNEELYDLLYELAQKRGDFDILVIETTGIADPAAVAETFWTGAFMEKTYDVKGTICLADAQNMLDAIENTDEARRQLSFADIVLINKCENLDDFQIKILTELVMDIHPGTEILYGSEGMFDVFEIMHFLDQHVRQKETKIDLVPKQLDNKHKGITTFTLTFDHPFDFRKLKHTLMLLLNVNKHQIYRIKGILDIPDMENKIILQSVYKTWRIEEGSPWVKNELRQSKIVFIGHEVKKESIERIFSQCLLKGGLSFA